MLCITALFYGVGRPAHLMLRHAAEPDIKRAELSSWGTLTEVSNTNTTTDTDGSGTLSDASIFSDRDSTRPSSTIFSIFTNPMYNYENENDVSEQGEDVSGFGYRGYGSSVNTGHTGNTATNSGTGSGSGSNTNRNQQHSNDSSNRTMLTTL